jgi:hypothetical protein
MVARAEAAKKFAAKLGHKRYGLLAGFQAKKPRV